MKRQFAITGALSYTGRYVTKQLIQRFGASNIKIINIESRKLTNPFSNELEMVTVPFDFEKPVNMSRALEGSEFFLASYWVRFDDFEGGPSRERVVQNAKTLVDAAERAGVGRYVFTSHTQSDPNCFIPYIAGKARVENYVKDRFAGRFGVVKPCAIFGATPRESILVNNLAYLMRTFPVLAVVGDGRYPLHPVHVEDVARLVVESGLDEHGLKEYDWDAVNPEKTDYIDLLETLRGAIGARTVFVKGVPESLAYWATKPINWWHDDILIDRTDINLMTEHITKSDKEALGRIRLSDWANENGNELGRVYINSMAQYYRN